jgi:hypothetical protein
MNRLMAASAALAAALAIVAGAHGLAAAGRRDSIFEPLTMDHHTPVSTLDIDFAYVAYDEPPNTDYTVMGITIGGQYVTPQGFGGYLSIPLSYLSYDATTGPLEISDNELAIGNVEVGGLYSKFFDRNAAIVLHGDIALPTASDDDLGIAQVLASSPRYGDLVHRITNSTWLRLGASPMGRAAGKLFWRADLGIDLALDEDNTPTLSPVFRVSVGGGIDLTTVHLLAELVTVVVDNDSDDESASTFALGARFISGKLRPGIALILPIGFDNTDINFALSVSLAARL